MKKKTVFIGTALGVLLVVFSVSLIEASAPGTRKIAGIFSIAPEPKDLLIVGDVMLARSVERYMREKGLENPFSKTKDLLASYDYVLGNFEGAIPEVHLPTPGMGFRFSIAEDIASALSLYGFTHMGLANNHAYDFGHAGYAHGRAVLASQGLFVGGSPVAVTEEDIMHIDVGEATIGIVPIFALDSIPSAMSLTPALQYAASTSDIQIAYIHWGAEYALVHNKTQEAFARTLISLGIDGIVGHHPHVIQDIAVHDGVPVFYSLGNFIFDQYWEESVRTGLTLGVQVEGEEVVFTLIGVQSKEKTVPEVLSEAEQEALLESIAERSAAELQAGIRSGELRFTMPL